MSHPLVVQAVSEWATLGSLLAVLRLYYDSGRWPVWKRALYVGLDLLIWPVFAVMMWRER